MVASSIGQIAPNAITNSAMPCVRPNSAMATGITADTGSGTLRQAITDANAVCGNNCRVAFRIPEAQRERGWFIIRPERPLPDISASVSIVGPPGAQPEGHRVNPQVMLDGSLLKFGNGLLISGGNDGGVSGLAIGNFPDAKEEGGIVVIETVNSTPL